MAGWWEMQYDGRLYHVKFHTEDGQFVMNGATLSRAICRAWLLWQYRNKPEPEYDNSDYDDSDLSGSK